MKIRINDKDEVYIDERICEINSLSIELIEKILMNSLDDKLDITFPENNTPITDFFRNLIKGTEKGSDLREQLKKSKQKIESEQEKINNPKDNYLDDL